MKRLGQRICTALAIVAIVVLAVTASADRDVDLYVAPNGDDGNPGTKEKPFASLERARDAIRRRRQSGASQVPITVWIRGGEYVRSETFQLQLENSGTSEAPVAYRAFGTERVHLVGGRRLLPAWFQRLTDRAVRARLETQVRDRVLALDLKSRGITNYGELGSLAGGMKLFFNGRRLPLARWPNDGWALARSARTLGVGADAAAELANERKLGQTLAFQYDGDPPNHWSSLECVWLRGYWQQEYQYDGWNPAGFDRDARRIGLNWQAPAHLQTWRRFFAANVLEEIDQPGEWYLDRKTGFLYLYPPAGFDDGRLLASMLQEAMIALDNTSHITIQGLTLEAMRGAAVVVHGGTHNLIAGCVIRNASQGVILANGTNNGVAGCDLYDLDSMGIRMSGGDRRTLSPAAHYAENNHIHHYARLLKTWHPGIKVQGVGMRVAHNRIHDAPQYAISYEGNDHVFEYNDMHDLCLEMSDVGVIGTGTDWTYRGNVIRYNYIHDIPERPYPGVIGVYFDNCASSARVFGNVFCNMTKPVMIGGGRDHVIENNIFIDCTIPVYMDNRGLRWGHFRPGGPMYETLDSVPYRKAPWSTRYPDLARIMDELPQAPLGNVLVRNVSYRSGWQDPEKACRATFGSNIDRKYMIIKDNYVTNDDPGFVDARNGNFELRGDSIIFQKIPMFVKIPFGKIGLYEDEYRSAWHVSRN